MKVLYLIDSMGVGGAQIILKNILDVKQDNWQSFLLVLREKRKQIELRGKNIYYYRSQSRINIGALWQAKKIITEEKIEIVHCHLLRSILFGLLLKFLWFPKIKIICHDHGWLARHPKIATLLLGWGRWQIDAFISVSENSKNLLLERLKIPIIKWHIFYNCFNFDEHQKVAEHRRDVISLAGQSLLTEGAFIIGFVGRLEKVKNCQLLLSALAICDDYIKLVVVGDGSLRKELEYMAQYLNIKSRISFVGWHKYVWSYYTIFDLLVVPSLFEGFGNVVVEAQSMGIPVIASNRGALSEIISDGINGLLFDPQNVADLVGKIKLIIEDNNLKQKLIRNGGLTCKQFTIKQYIYKLNKLYRKVINN